MELGIVTANDVNRYVENSLSESGRKVIEQTLLDDERARQLVIEKSDKDEAPPLAEDAVEKLASTVEVCQQCLVGYEVLQSGDGPAPFLDFAADRFVKRWTYRSAIAGPV